MLQVDFWIFFQIILLYFLVLFENFVSKVRHSWKIWEEEIEKVVTVNGATIIDVLQHLILD